MAKVLAGWSRAGQHDARSASRSRRSTAAAYSSDSRLSASSSATGSGPATGSGSDTKATVDGEELARDVAGAIRRQERNCLGDVLGGTESAQRDVARRRL